MEVEGGAVRGPYLHPLLATAALVPHPWRQRASRNPKSGRRSTGTAGADQEAPHSSERAFFIHVTKEKNNWVGGS